MFSLPCPSPSLTLTLPQQQSWPQTRHPQRIRKQCCTSLRRPNNASSPRTCVQQPKLVYVPIWKMIEKKKEVLSICFFCMNYVSPRIRHKVFDHPWIRLFGIWDFAFWSLFGFRCFFDPLIPNTSSSSCLRVLSLLLLLAVSSSSFSQQHITAHTHIPVHRPSYFRLTCPISDSSFSPVHP